VDGVTFFNGEGGVWLIHSVPKFPPPNFYQYPRSGHHYGQTMLCLSLPYSQLENIATQLYYNKPDIYSSQLPTTMAADYPVLAQVIAGKYKLGEPSHNIVELTTVGGQTFKSFAKTGEFNHDLYDGLVAPTLKTDLIAETWRRGLEVPLDCSTTYHTNDALKIQVGSTISFKYTKDHSKMARSTNPSKPWLCIGDINRMTSQYVRGGGTTCISSKLPWKAFDVIKSENRC
uniref:Plancitoxin-1 n=1 Tax=Angiostrongylus cantonensis TaxID=6313 RepID=A0A0K0D5B0_ANGCA